MLFFLPHLRAARAAAEGLVAVTSHLHQVDLRLRQNGARRIQNAVMAPQVARIVIGHRPNGGQIWLELAGCDQFGDQLGVMHHGEVAAVLRILLAQGVQAVRAGRNDALGLELIEGFDVGLRQFKEKGFVTGAAGAVTGAVLHLAQDSKVDACGLENLGKITRSLLRAAVIRGRAAHPPEDIEVWVVFHGRNVEVGGPGHAIAAGQVPGVAGTLHALERRL